MKSEATKVLVLGAGRQGRAAILDLVHHGHDVVAADLDVQGLLGWATASGLDSLQCCSCDAGDDTAVSELLGRGFAVVVDLLPVPLHDRITRAALRHRVHLVSSSYTSPVMTTLGRQAAASGVTLLPELGLDPGIDLVLLGEAVRRFEAVEEVRSYAAGFPEAGVAKPPLRYKLTWNLEGVLRSYHRCAEVLRQGQAVHIPAGRAFDPEHIHEIKVAGVGCLEAFPNGDALRYADLLGLDRATLTDMGRFVMRWPGHAALWRTLINLGLLDEEPVHVEGRTVDRRQFLAAAWEQQLSYQDHERDVVVVRIEVIGRRAGDGSRSCVRLQVVDYRDSETGLFAMNRTVGFSAAIGAGLIADGTIGKRGLLSPVVDVPYRRFVQELAARGILVSEEER